MTILYSVIIFSVLIFVHELGHFGVAKATGIKVKEFALGMGPAIFKKTKGETQYSLRVFPIGGFCAMEGEDEDSEDERAFNNKPFFVKAGVLIAGSVMNLLLAILILSSIVLYFGTPTTTLDKISSGSPAAVAGILAGDKVSSINNIKIKDWETVSSAINSGGDKPVNIKIIRNGEVISKDIMPVEEDGRKIIGVTPTFQKNPISAIKYGTIATWEMGGKMVDVIGQLFTGQVSAKELMGPLGIVNAVGDSAKYGLVYVAQLAALISLNLAIVNMLPLPALDGGRIFMLFIRKLTGKAITDEIEGKIHLIGFALLIGLMVYVTYQDVLRIF